MLKRGTSSLKCVIKKVAKSIYLSLKRSAFSHVTIVVVVFFYYSFSGNEARLSQIDF